MKKFIFILLITCILNAAQCDEFDPDYNYDKFMIHFGRTYTGEEKLKHERFFNMNYLDLMKRKLNGEDVIVNDFLDWDDQQKESFLNYKPQNSGFPISSIPLRSEYLFATPTTFDWRSLGRVTPIKSQGGCGSCWAFSSTAQYESALAIQTNGTIYDLAQQYGTQCDKGSGGCNGGYPPSALKLYNVTGIPLQTQYPYKANSTYYDSTVICSENNTVKLQSKIPLIYHYTNLTIQQIQQNLMSYGPTTVAVYADNGFMSTGSTGLIQKCTMGTANHAILLVGYNSTHWFIKNSWGTSWGNKGFGYILKTNDCKLNAWVDVMQVNYPFVPTPTPTPTPTPPAGFTTLTINMTDSKSNGCNGTILGLSQNGVIVAVFGDNFTTGAASGPLLVTIASQVQTSIVVVQLGNGTNEVGFTIYNIEGTILFNKIAGATFTSATVFGSICPTFGCVTPTIIDFYITLTSTGAGWYGNTLSFRQNGSIVATVGANFTSGKTFGPFIISFQPALNVDIVVEVLGNYTDKVGFAIRTAHGYIVFQRVAGTAFYSNSLLGSFVPSALNYVPEDITTTSTTTATSTSTDNNVSQSSFNKVLIATIVMGFTQLVMLGLLVFLGFKLYQSSRKYTSNPSLHTSSISAVSNEEYERKRRPSDTLSPGSAVTLHIP